MACKGLLSGVCYLFSGNSFFNNGSANRVAYAAVAGAGVASATGNFSSNFFYCYGLFSLNFFFSFVTAAREESNACYNSD